MNQKTLLHAAQKNRRFGKNRRIILRELIAALFLFSLLFGQPAGLVQAASTFTVTKTADTNDGVCDADCSLREAIAAANAAASTSGSPNVINIPAGTYNLGNVGTVELQVGNATNLATNIVGAGAGATIIHQTIANQRVFDLDPNTNGNVTVNISGVTISGGTGTAFGGGGILGGWTGDSTTLDQVTITGNTTSGSNQGGGISWGGGGNLTITNSTITSNSSDLIGAGVAFNMSGNPGGLTISNTRITNNTVTNIHGLGAGLLITGLNTITINNSTFTGNTIASGGSDAQGGAIQISGGTLNMSFSRITGNSAGSGSGSGLYKAGGATANVTNNWWGCNGGPGAAGCDSIANGAGSSTFNPWIVLSNTASPSTISIGQATTLSASFLQNSAAAPLSASQVSELVGLPVSWGNAALGSLSAQQTTIQTNGVATATFTANSGGAGHADATVDNATATASITINKADTTTAITSDTPDPSVVGQPVTVSYSVTSGGGTPTGNVTVSDGTVSCTGTVASGQCSLTFTSAGAKSLTATYAGDTSFNGSTSAAEAHQVNKADTTTTITSDNPDPSNAGQSVTVTFNVAVTAPGAGTPTGNVTVSDGTVSCTGTVAAGQCSLTFTSGGNKTLTATYAGDSNFNGSTSAGEPHSVGNLTITTITSDTPDPSVVGQSVTVQFTVAPNGGSGTPTGNVTVSDGTVSCTGTVASGQCSLTFTSAGAKSLTATYAGDANFNGSTSAAEAHQVNKADTTTTITSDTPDPSAGSQSVNVQYSVAVTAPGSGTPTGNVTVSDGVDSCTGTVAAGQCAITLTTGGNRTLTATYAGDSNFNGSTSAGEPHLVDNIAPTVTIDQAAGQADPTATSPINFTAVFSEPVTGFTASDVTIGGTAGATTAVVTGGPTTFNVAIIGMTAGGTVTASIPANAAVDVVGNPNQASTSTDNTVTFLLPPDLTISKSHTGNFFQGQTGAQYTLTVNNIGASATNGAVSVVDTLPAGLTATAMSGAGWTCTLGTLTCTRSDALASGSSYPIITLTVTVDGHAPASLTNSASVSGGGELNTGNDSATDPTTILTQPGRVTPTSATCAQFANGSAADLSNVLYTVQSGRISSVNPTAFYYYTKVTAPSASFQIQIKQSNTQSWPALGLQSPQVALFDANCASLSAQAGLSPTTVTVNITGATTGAVYYVRIRYAPGILVGRTVSSPYPTVPYTFTTSVNNVLLAPNTDSVNIKPQ